MNTTKKSVRLSDVTIARLMQHKSEGVSFAKVLERFAKLGLDYNEQSMQDLVRSARVTHPPVPPPMIMGTQYNTIADAEIAANVSHNQRIMDEARAEEEEEKSEEAFSTVGPKDLMKEYGDQIREQYK